MKLKLITNRFVETDSIDVPINVTTSFDDAGVSQLLNFMSQLRTATANLKTPSINMFDETGVKAMEQSFGKIKDLFNSFLGTSQQKYPFTDFTKNMENDMNSFAGSVINGMTLANRSISDTSAINKYEDTISHLKESARTSVKDFFLVSETLNKATSSIMEVSNAYDSFVNKLRESQSLVLGLNNFNVDDLFSGFKESQSLLLSFNEQTKREKDIQNNMYSGVTPTINNYKEALDKATNSQNNLNNAQNRSEKSSENAKRGLEKLSSMLKGTLLIQIQGLANFLKRAFTFIEQSFTAAGDYVESINLYTMSVGQYADAGKKWATEIRDALYLDDAEIYQYTGQFFNLTRGLGASAKAADLMSRNLTQLTYDMSSYLNIKVDVANNKLMSAMSGQTKAVTSVGVAVQSASLQELAYSLGIDKAVESMTQAEKTYLRYIQIMRSTTQMQGDLGRTIITPTNAMRLLRTQLNLLSRALGQVFTPIVMEIIPVVIAFTQVLTDLAHTLADLMGYHVEDYLAPADSVKELADGFEDLEDAAKGAGDRINRTLAPFDELNVVQKTTQGRGSGGDDSVLSELEKYLTGYDMLEFYTDAMKEKVDRIKGSVQNLLPLVEGVGIAFLSWKIGSSVTDFFKDNEGLLSKKIGLSLIIGGVAFIWKGTMDLEKDFWLGVGEKLGGTLAMGVGTYMLTKKFSLALAVTGISLLTQSFIDRDKFELSLAEALGGSVALGGTTYMLTRSVTLSLAVTGLSLIGEGLAQLLGDGDSDRLGGPFGEFVDKVKELSTLSGSYDPLIQKAEEFNTSLKKQYDAIKEVMDANLVLVDNHKSLYDELQNLVDENGNVKQGYEDRVQFILNELKNAYGIEYELVNGQIKNYDDLKKSIEEVIAKKKLEILLEANKEAYIIALKNEKKADDLLTDAQKDVNTQKAKLEGIEKKLSDARAKLNDKQGKSIKQLTQEAKELRDVELEYYAQQEVLKKSEQQRDLYKDAVYRNTEAIKNYEAGMAASYSNDMKTIMNVTDQMTGHNDKSLKQQIEDTIIGRDKIVDYWKRTTGEITNNEIEEKKKQVQNTIDTLKSQSQSVANLTPQVTSAWSTLAQLDRQAFYNGIKDLPEDVRQRLSNIPNSLDGLSPEMQRVAAKLGKLFGDNMSGNLVINGHTLNSSLIEALKNVRLPLWLKNTPLGHMASNLGFQFAAEGGFFNTGEMFVAREAGPEMVGKIGNKTAVANNDQITTAMTNAMVVALSGMNMDKKQPIHNTVYIGSDKVFDKMNDYVDSENDRYGTNYIRI